MLVFWMFDNRDNKNGKRLTATVLSSHCQYVSDTRGIEMSNVL